MSRRRPVDADLAGPVRRPVPHRAGGGHPAARAVGAAAGTLLVQSGEPAWALITVATLGNSAGSAVNWWLGRYLTRFQDRRWFPFSPESLRKAEGWYHRYGRWTLLCSWMPVIGDPLTLVAGTLREPLPSFLLLVVLAKLGRYLAVAGVALALW